MYSYVTGMPYTLYMYNKPFTRTNVIHHYCINEHAHCKQKCFYTVHRIKYMYTDFLNVNYVQCSIVYTLCTCTYIYYTSYAQTCICIHVHVNTFNIHTRYVQTCILYMYTIHVYILEFCSDMDGVLDSTSDITSRQPSSSSERSFDTGLLYGLYAL